MQANKQNFDSQKESLKRPKSITRYPTNGPTYVVAFSMHENYDDLMTAQQMISKKSSPQDSINSVTPTNSLKVLVPNAVDKCSHIIDIPEDITTNQLEDPNESFDVEKVFDTERDENERCSKIDIIQPEVIFNASHTKPTRDDKLKKKPRKNKRVASFRNEHFKCKHSQKSITKKLELYCTKSKRHTMASDVLETGLCSLSNVITQSRVLKKVLAVENLLGANPPKMNDVISNDGLSSLSSSTTKKGILSHSSDNTITRKWSSTSSKTDEYSMNAHSSVIQVSSENVIPYKNDVFNVAVAVAFNKNKVNERKMTAKPIITRTEEKYLGKENLTGTETVIIPQAPLTSKIPLYTNANLNNSRAPHTNVMKDASSDDTLIGNRQKSSLVMSIDEENFVIARTSSDFNKSTASSNLISTTSESQSDKTLHDQEELASGSEYNNKKLLDTVINLGLFPEETPSTSKLDPNAVIITKEHKTYAKKEEETFYTEQNDLPKNILKKTFDFVKNVGAQKIINLPDEAAIRSKLKENQESQHKVNIENPKQNQNPHPSTLAEMWDRLILLIEAGLKRIEDTLPEKIINEIKRVFDFDDYKNFLLKAVSEKKLNAERGRGGQTKGVHVDMSKTEMDRGLQCNLIQNQVIDQLMVKLYPEGTNDLNAKLSQKLITKIFKEYFDVVTPTVASNFGIKEDVTMTGTEPELAENAERFRRLKILLAVPLKFIKENAFVITSVPTFFILLLSVYGLVIFIMKPL